MIESAKDLNDLMCLRNGHMAISSEELTCLCVWINPEKQPSEEDPEHLSGVLRDGDLHRLVQGLAWSSLALLVHSAEV